MDWDTESDTLSMEPRDVTDECFESRTTERQVLQATARFITLRLTVPCIHRWEITVSVQVVQRISLGRNLGV